MYYRKTSQALQPNPAAQPRKMPQPARHGSRTARKTSIAAQSNCTAPASITCKQPLPILFIGIFIVVSIWKGLMRSLFNLYCLLAAAILLPVASLSAADMDTRFHGAPESARKAKNPLQGQDAAARAGQQLYSRNCLSCHGRQGKGTGSVPSLVSEKLASATPGEVFWFITRGDKNGGMPAWASLPAKQRWEIVSYVTSALPALSTQGAASATSPDRAADDKTASKFKAPPPTPPFTDFRYEKPGTVRKITANDLPQPYATDSIRE